MLGSVRLRREISRRPRSRELTRTSGHNLGGLQHRLGAELRVFVHYKILQIEAGLRQQAKSDRSHVHRAS